MVMRWMVEPTNEQKRQFLNALGTKHEFDKCWPLPNMKSSTERDFWDWRSTWGFKGELFISAHNVGTKKKPPFTWAVTLIYYVDVQSMAGGGFAVNYVYSAKPPRVEYFTWSACDHKWQARKDGNCLTMHTCKKCKTSYEVDSSD